MEFTREPIVESVITPRDGCKLVVRSSKGIGQEEFFVDALEMVSFGGCFFFRSLERPKSFLVPVSDYEVIEVRDTRMVVKNASVERGAIKIGGGRASGKESPKAEEQEQKEGTGREKKRRRQSRRRRGRDEAEKEVSEAPAEEREEREPRKPVEAPAAEATPSEAPSEESTEVVSPSLSSLLPPPSTLISDSIHRYKEDESFKGAFFDPEEEAPRDREPAQETAPREEEPSADPFGERGGSEVSGEEAPVEEAIPPAEEPAPVAEKPAPAFDESHWILPGTEPEEEPADTPAEPTDAASTDEEAEAEEVSNKGS